MFAQSTNTCAPITPKFETDQGWAPESGNPLGGVLDGPGGIWVSLPPGMGPSISQHQHPHLACFVARDIEMLMCADYLQLTSRSVLCFALVIATWLACMSGSWSGPREKGPRCAINSNRYYRVRAQRNTSAATDPSGGVANQPYRS